MYELELYGKKYEVEVGRTTYANNSSLAILLETVDGEPFATLTVNLCDGVANNEYAYVDINNCSWAKEFIEKNKLGTPTGRIGYSGFCQYPLYKFNIEQIKELG